MPLMLEIYKQWEDSRDRTFISLLDYDPKAKVIDLGCGNCQFTLKIRERIGCNEIHGVDISDESLQEALNKGILVRKLDLNEFFPLDNSSVDVVVSNQVIEHLFYPVRFIKEIYRILRPQGYAVISTENLASWDNVLALLCGYTPFSMSFDAGLYKIGNPLSPHDKELAKEGYAHVRILTFIGLVELVRFVGFEVERVLGRGHIFGNVGELANNKRCRFTVIKVRKCDTLH